MNLDPTTSQSKSPSAFGELVTDVVTRVVIDLNDAWRCLKYPDQRMRDIRISIAEEAIRHAVNLIGILPENHDTSRGLQQRLQHACERFYVESPLKKLVIGSFSDDNVSIKIESEYRNPSDNFEQSRALDALQREIAGVVDLLSKGERWMKDFYKHFRIWDELPLQTEHRNLVVNMIEGNGLDEQSFGRLQVLIRIHGFGLFSTTSGHVITGLQFGNPSF
jgi:hypothetical protein